MVFEYHSLDEIDEAAKWLIEHAEDHKIWLFEGDMGAGKTTLIKSVGQFFGIVDMITSPTFSLVNEYLDAHERSYYHFDFYRIKDQNEAVDMGAEEYFYSGAFCFVEWADKIPDLIPENYLKININLVSAFGRKLTLTENDRSL